MSPAGRCDFVGMKLEKVHELFQVCRTCEKGVVFYNRELNERVETRKREMLGVNASV